MAGQLESGKWMPVSPIVLRPRADDLKGDGEINADEVLLGDPIVGVEEVRFEEGRGFGAREPRALPAPKQPTEAQRAKHNLTHLNYETWCPFCVAGRRNNSHHRPSHESSRSVPLVVADYAFLRNQSDEDVATVLVVKILPYKIFFSCVVDAKGVDNDVVQRLAQLFKDLGLVHFVYRSDKEPAIRAMLEQAIIASGRDGKAFADADVDEKEILTVMEERRWPSHG